MTGGHSCEREREVTSGAGPLVSERKKGKTEAGVSGLGRENGPCEKRKELRRGNEIRPERDFSDFELTFALQKLS